MREQFGTREHPFRIWATGQDAFTREGLEELESIGVTDVVIGFRDVFGGQPDQDIHEKLSMIEWYAREFIQEQATT